MTEEARHGKQTIINGVHTAIAYKYDNAADRLAATDVDDRNKLSRDLDTNDVYMLIDPLVPTWNQINGGVGASTFLDLSDVPSAYTGAALQATRVNAGENSYFGLQSIK